MSPYMMENGLNSVDIVLVQEQLVHQRRRPSSTQQKEGSATVSERFLVVRPSSLF